jgi:hypothetical protein
VINNSVITTDSQEPQKEDTTMVDAFVESDTLIIDDSVDMVDTAGTSFL